MLSINVSARAPQLDRRSESGDYLGRAVTQSVIFEAAGPRRCVRKAADDAAQCCYTPRAVFGNTEAACYYGRNQWEQLNRELFSPAKRGKCVGGGGVGGGGVVGRQAGCNTTERLRDPGNFPERAAVTVEGLLAP